jgi:hypothetical protein
MMIDRSDSGTTKFTSPAGTTTQENIKAINKAGHRTLSFKEAGVDKTIELYVTYDVNIFDQTNNSISKGQHPEIVLVDAGQSATLNDGPNLGNYQWKNINDATSTGSASDSIKVAGKGTYITTVDDGTGHLSSDTISVVEKPIVNATTKSIDFSTTAGVYYSVALLNGSTWNEVSNFVGDGNTKSISGLADGDYKVTFKKSSTATEEASLTLNLKAVVVIPPVQASATIDPKYYSISNPYIVPNLTDKSTLTLNIKTGAKTPISIDGMDAGSSTLIWENGHTIPLSDVIVIDKPGLRTWEYKEN